MSIPNSQISFGKNLQNDLFSKVAKEKAFEIFQGGLDQRGTQSKNKSTQLRKFYDELCMWSDKVHANIKLEKDQKSESVREVRYTQCAPFIKMMNAKVAYAKGRGHVDESFEAMFSHCITTISNAETLKHAKLFMEAFMGFYKAQEK